MMKLMRIPGQKGQAAVPRSMDASFNGTAMNLEYLDGFSICADVVESSAALAGTLKLQACNNAFQNNADGQENSAAIWVDIPSSSVTLTSGNTTVFWNVSDVFYEAIRLAWTRSSGQGTISSYVVAKGQA